MRASSVLALAALAAACSPPAATTDASTDGASPSDATDAVSPPQDTGPDPHMGLRLPRCEDSEPAGDPMLAPVASTLLGTIVPMAAGPVSTPDTSNDPILESAELSYRMRGFDQYMRGPAQMRVRRAELGGDAPAGASRHSIAYFVQISDYQFVDDESPNRLLSLESPDTSGAVRPQEAYLARYISAMNRTLAALQGSRHYQFGVFAGDCADSAQQNELGWFMQAMNGEPALNTDSGDDNDPVPGPDNDPKDPFDPVGFPAPWYFVPGNHDVDVVGVYLADMGHQTTAVGSNSSLGTRDYTQWYAPPHTGHVVPDPNRRLLDRPGIVAQLQGGPATPGPVGHGYHPGMDVSLGAHYTADVIPGLLRMIAVDTSDDTGGSVGLMHQSEVDGFLRPALEQAQTDGMLVMLASHHPTDSIDQRASETGAPVPDAVAPTAIEQLVAQYPNVVLWLVGHQHDVRVRPIHGADASHPGYWEVQSGSIADWPGQSRIVEIVDNGNGTLSIFGTMIDAELSSCMERRYRRLQMMDWLSAWERDHTGTLSDRNVELVVPIPASAAARVATASMAAPTAIESETTLRGMH